MFKKFLDFWFPKKYIPQPGLSPVNINLENLDPEKLVKLELGVLRIENTTLKMKLDMYENYFSLDKFDATNKLIRLLMNNKIIARVFTVHALRGKNDPVLVISTKTIPKEIVQEIKKIIPKGITCFFYIDKQTVVHYSIMEYSELVNVEIDMIETDEVNNYIKVTAKGLNEGDKNFNFMNDIAFSCGFYGIKVLTAPIDTKKKISEEDILNLKKGLENAKTLDDILKEIDKGTDKESK